MPSPIEPLILDLVAWVARAPRRYPDVLASWGTSCPRLTVWEDTIERGLVERRLLEDGEVWVVATEAGRDALKNTGSP